jgi:hypothetical protein
MVSLLELFVDQGYFAQKVIVKLGCEYPAASLFVGAILN